MSTPDGTDRTALRRLYDVNDQPPRSKLGPKAPVSPHAGAPGNRGQVPHPPVGDKKASESAVYRLFDSTGQVLYIGMSRNPMARWGIHAEQHSWWPRVATYELAWYPTRQEAEAAEKAAIKAESPTCNVAHTPRQGQRIMAAIHRETFRPLAGHT